MKLIQNEMRLELCVNKSLRRQNVSRDEVEEDALEMNIESEAQDASNNNSRSKVISHSKTSNSFKNSLDTNTSTSTSDWIGSKRNPRAEKNAKVRPYEVRENYASKYVKLAATIRDPLLDESSDDGEFLRSGKNKYANKNIKFDNKRKTEENISG